MKLIRFFILALVVLPMLFQSCASGLTGTARKAGTSLESGDLAEAKVLIDSAIQDSVVQQDPKAWMTYGDVYLSIATDSTNSVEAEDPLRKAYKGYSQVLEMEDTSSLLGVQADQQIQQVWANAINKGADNYSNQNYAEAVDYFAIARQAVPEDTTAYIYGGISAQQAGDMAVAADNYAYLLDSLDYVSKDFYNSLIYIYLIGDKDMDKGLDYLRKAQEAFPDDPEFLNREITLLINNEEYDEAVQKLARAIEMEPDNPVIHYNQGYLYEQMDKGEQAVESYKKAIEVDPQYFDANFNLAAYYYNRAAEILTEANNMDLQEYQEKGEEIENNAKIYFEKALPYFENSIDINPDSEKALTSLSTIYQRLGMDEKAEEVNSKLESM
jgi:tetratricopeptide (TPR) repeat protein